MSNHYVPLSFMELQSHSKKLFSKLPIGLIKSILQNAQNTVYFLQYRQYRMSHHQIVAMSLYRFAICFVIHFFLFPPPLLYCEQGPQYGVNMYINQNIQSARCRYTLFWVKTTQFYLTLTYIYEDPFFMVKYYRWFSLETMLVSK